MIPSGFGTEMRLSPYCELGMAKGGLSYLVGTVLGFPQLLRELRPQWLADNGCSQLPRKANCKGPEEHSGGSMPGRDSFAFQRVWGSARMKKDLGSADQLQRIM